MSKAKNTLPSGTITDKIALSLSKTMLGSTNLSLLHVECLTQTWKAYQEANVSEWTKAIFLNTMIIDTACQYEAYVKRMFKVHLNPLYGFEGFKHSPWVFEKYLKANFKMDLNRSFLEWASFKEVYARRNLIVHNESRINKGYWRKFPNRKYLTDGRLAVLNQMVFSNYQYVKDAMKTLFKLKKFIYGALCINFFGFEKEALITMMKKICERNGYVKLLTSEKFFEQAVNP